MYHGVKWFKCNPQAYSYNLVAFEKLENLIQMINVRDKLLHLVDYDLNILFARLQNYPPPHLKLDEMKREDKQYDEDFSKSKLETRS